MTEKMKVDQPSSDITNASDDDPSTFLSSLPEPLRGYAITAFSSPGDNGTAEADSNNDTAKLDELEISTRSHLLELVEQLLSCQDNNNNDATNESIKTILVYLKNVTLLCLHAVKHHSVTSNAIKKLPFLLLEDAIDSLPLTHIQTLWSSSQYPTLNISSYTTSLLCSPTIFVVASKFVLLRICNKLLKVLSNRDVDSEFAGSLMMMLAKVFPLSERSAVNVLGSFNVANETLFEEREEFDGKGSMLGEEEDEGKSSKRGKGSNIGYDFYKTFWGVQKIFTDPQGSILASRGGLTAAAAATAYNGFMKDVTSILVALESTPVVPKSTTSTSEPSQFDDTASTANIVRHHKYLTSSQLLHLQLKDAQLRIHFLTQLIIILSYLNSPSVALPMPPLASTPGSDTVKLTAQIKATQVKQMSQIEKRTMQLLRATNPPLGENMWRFLQWLLKEREAIWRNWKRAKCMPALDKVGTVDVTGNDIKRLLGKKRKASTLDGGDKKDRIDISTLPGITSQITKSLPTLDTFLEPYKEALDPENGIEGEYHPRNDKVYSWRALRLTARDQTDNGQLAKFNKIRRKDGDFEGIVRTMYSERGEEIGGSIDEDYYAEEVETEPASEEKVADLDMDDVSVGTPQEDAEAKEEDAEAKKEKMAEFEKMAMEVEEEMLNEDEEEEAKDNVKKEDVEEKEGAATDADAIEEKSSKDEIRDAAAETALSMLSEEPIKEEESKEQDAAAEKQESPEKEAKPAAAVKKEEPTDKDKDDASTKRNGRGKRNGKKRDEPKKKDEPRKKDEPKKEEQKKDERKPHQQQPRAKFVPPQKSQQQLEQQKQNNDFSNPRGRYGGGGRSRGGQGGRNQDHQQQQKQRDNSADGRRSRIPPPQQQNDHRDSGGSKGRDGGRDNRSRSPPNKNASEAQNAPRGSDRGGGGGRGRGNWEPPHSGRGGGPPGRGGGGRGGYRDSRRGRGRR